MKVFLLFTKISMNVRLVVSVISTRHVTIFMDHTVVNVTTVSLEMERTALVYRTIVFFSLFFFQMLHPGTLPFVIII